MEGLFDDEVAVRSQTRGGIASYSILVVDDDCAYRALARNLLSATGCGIREAANGIEALEQLSKAPADLAIVDIFMAGPQGIETIAQVKEHYPHVKIVAVSGAGQGNVYFELSKCVGADATLSKMQSRRDLVELTHRLLAQ